MLTRWYRYQYHVGELRAVDALIQDAEAAMDIPHDASIAERQVFRYSQLGELLAERDSVIAALKPHIDYVEDLTLQVRNLTEKIEKAMEKVAAHSDSAGLLSSAYADLTTLKAHRAMLIEKINDYKQECPGLYEKEDTECRP